MSKLLTGFGLYAVVASMGVQFHAGQRLILSAGQQDRMAGLFGDHPDGGHVLKGSAGFKRGEEIALFGDVPKALLEQLESATKPTKPTKRRAGLVKEAEKLNLEFAPEISDADLEASIAARKAANGGGEG